MIKRDSTSSLSTADSTNHPLAATTATPASIAADTVTPAGNSSDPAAACARSSGSVFLMLYICAVMAVVVMLALMLCSVPRLRLQLEVVYRLLRADRAGSGPLPITDVIRVVREGNLAQAERLIRGSYGDVSYYSTVTSSENVSYGSIVPPNVNASEKLQV